MPRAMLCSSAEIVDIALGTRAPNTAYRAITARVGNGALSDKELTAPAQYIRAPGSNVYLICDDLRFEEAAATPVAFFAAWQMLVMRANLRPSETVLVAAAASGVGSAALQIAKLVGARIIAAAGSDAKFHSARQ